MLKKVFSSLSFRRLVQCAYEYDTSECSHFGTALTMPKSKYAQKAVGFFPFLFHVLFYASYWFKFWTRSAPFFLHHIRLIVYTYTWVAPLIMELSFKIMGSHCCTCIETNLWWISIVWIIHSSVLPFVTTWPRLPLPTHAWFNQTNIHKFYVMITSSKLASDTLEVAWYLNWFVFITRIQQCCRNGFVSVARGIFVGPHSYSAVLNYSLP